MLDETIRTIVRKEKTLDTHRNLLYDSQGDRNGEESAADVSV